MLSNDHWPLGQLLEQQPGELLLFILMKFPQKKIQDKLDYWQGKYNDVDKAH